MPSWTASAERSGDGAFERATGWQIFHAARAGESGVALRLPPQSMTRWQKTGLSPRRAELQWHQP